MDMLKFRLQSEHVSLCVVTTEPFVSHCGRLLVCGIVFPLVWVQPSSWEGRRQSSLQINVEAFGWEMAQVHCNATVSHDSLATFICNKRHIANMLSSTNHGVFVSLNRNISSQTTHNMGKTGNKQVVCLQWVSGFSLRMKFHFITNWFSCSFEAFIRWWIVSHQVSPNMRVDRKTGAARWSWWFYLNLS